MFSSSKEFIQFASFIGAAAFWLFLIYFSALLS